MTDLTTQEQKHVRTVLHHLRRRMLGWASVAAALHVSADTLPRIANGTGRHVPTASLAFRVARLVGCSVDDLVCGRFIPGACPKCGHVPNEEL